MPTASQHKTKADRSRQLLASLDVAAYPDWAATIAFYIAVHVVDRLRYAAGHGHSTDHQERLLYVQTHLRAVHHQFRELWNVSKIARYEANATFFNQLSADDVQALLIDQHLADIETHVRNALGS